MVPTQDGYYNVFFEAFNGASGDKVESSDHISTVHKGVSGRCMGGLEPHGQSTQAALRGSMERLAALEEGLVQVEADICLQALWETLQDLRVHMGQSRHGHDELKCP